MENRCRAVLAVILVSSLRVILSAPIKVSFDSCKLGAAPGIGSSCCPPNHQRPIVDFLLVHNSSKPVRIRRALQCLDQDELAIYQEKLVRAYALMRALPADDPRSFHNQHLIHCAYGSGSLDNSGSGLDVHFGWLFHPWHRWFLYFHERILQSLLEDPTFTIHFWNWDNDGAPGPGQSKSRCFKAGNRLPAMYADPSSPLFHSKRSWRAMVPSVPVDLGVDYTVTSTTPQLADDVVLSRNPQVLHDTMVIDSVSARIFFGKEYRAGDEKPEALGKNAIGSLELHLHASTHFWIGEDMAATLTAARDPIFYAHHGNVERLWDVWHRLGPGRADPLDPDFLVAEFLFYDENADLVRVKVRDVLDQRALGYDYEQTNDASWNYGVETLRTDNSSTSEHFGSLFSSQSQA